MFAVRICIYTDGDFGYDDPEFKTKGDEEKTFYFETREEAVKALIRSFHNLKNSIRPCGRENIKRWIDSMDNRIELIAKKIHTFMIDKDFVRAAVICDEKYKKNVKEQLKNLTQIENPNSIVEMKNYLEKQNLSLLSLDKK